MKAFIIAVLLSFSAVVLAAPYTEAYRHEVRQVAVNESIEIYYLNRTSVEKWFNGCTRLSAKELIDKEKFVKDNNIVGAFRCRIESYETTSKIKVPASYSLVLIVKKYQKK